MTAPTWAAYTACRTCGKPIGYDLVRVRLCDPCLDREMRRLGLNPDKITKVLNLITGGGLH